MRSPELRMPGWQRCRADGSNERREIHGQPAQGSRRFRESTTLLTRATSMPSTSPRRPSRRKRSGSPRSRRASISWSINHSVTTLPVVRMTQAAAANGVCVMDATHFVHHPRTAAIRAACPEKIGTPRTLHTTFYFPFSDRNNIRFDQKQEPMTAAGGHGVVFDAGGGRVSAT